MFCQLGNIIFTIPFGINTYQKTDATAYAQHDIIGGKPVLQPTANELEEISIAISLHAEFCNVAQTIASLKANKDSFEVLPFLFGDGRYSGDYVITNIDESYDDAFEDGTPIRATVNLTLKEYQVADQLSQLQNAARKNAFAIGNKKPVITGLSNPPTIPQTASADITAVNSESANIDDAVSEYEDNVSKQDYLKQKMQKSLQNINDNIKDFNSKVEEVQDYYDDITGLQNAVAGVTEAVTDFSFKNVNHILQSNLNLQAANRNLQTATVPLNFNIISRRA